MLVPSRFDHNRRSVPHTSNDRCVYGLPTFADPVAKDQVAPIPDLPALALGRAHSKADEMEFAKGRRTAIRSARGEKNSLGQRLQWHLESDRQGELADHLTAMHCDECGSDDLSWLLPTYAREETRESHAMLFPDGEEEVQQQAIDGPAGRGNTRPRTLGSYNVKPATVCWPSGCARNGRAILPSYVVIAMGALSGLPIPDLYRAEPDICARVSSWRRSYRQRAAWSVFGRFLFSVETLSITGRGRHQRCMATLL